MEFDRTNRSLRVSGENYHWGSRTQGSWVYVIGSVILAVFDVIGNRLAVLWMLTSHNWSSAELRNTIHQEQSSNSD